ncbi:hypothetical protein Dimus_036674, partial [Dionaea muscipula]
ATSQLLGDIEADGGPALPERGTTGRRRLREDLPGRSWPAGGMGVAMSGFELHPRSISNWRSWRAMRSMARRVRAPRLPGRTSMA